MFAKLACHSVCLYFASTDWYLLLMQPMSALSCSFQLGEVAIPLLQQWNSQSPIVRDAYLAETPCNQQYHQHVWTPCDCCSRTVIH